MFYVSYVIVLSHFKTQPGILVRRCPVFFTPIFCNFAAETNKAMQISNIQQKIKPWVMPVAILCGALFHDYIGACAFLTPYLIFSMLFLTFSRLEISELRFSRGMWYVLVVQICGALAVFFPLRLVNASLAQAIFITVYCPVATAAPVVTGLLGGKIGKVAAFSVLSNLAVAVTAPLLLPVVNPESASSISYFDEFTAISLHVAPMIVLPLLFSLILRFTAPRLSNIVKQCAPLSFWLWSVSLIIVVGKSVSFVLMEPPAYWPVMTAMAVGSAAACALLFACGKKIGSAEEDSISLGQSLGQKNTILGIWLALNYLNPIASVGPAAYVVWQNCFNSFQIYRKVKHDANKAAE